MADHMKPNQRPIWIDLDNSPHVPFFRPIIEELQARGIPVLLTARDAFQVTQLIELYKIPCTTVGKHFGKNKIMKGLGLLVRSAQLLPLILRHRPQLAVSHGSRAQTMVARLLSIPSIVIADYEHARHVTKPDWMIVPEVIPTESASKSARHVLKYPGIKEDVYTPSLSPDPGLLKAMGLSPDEIIVTVRPPATEAHYHNPESESLFAATIELLAAHPATRIVVLPRNRKQQDEIVRAWPALMKNQKLIIPNEAVDGLNLVWHSDFVISGGGTMNREAAALGVPVYSIFRGHPGAVDLYLASKQRMTLLESVDDVRRKISVAKRDRGHAPDVSSRRTLQALVGLIMGVAAETRAMEH
ncbi:DUF354 domain-containing protein [Azohydromonas aeria]|uniref:DUF354 domain-containing protein n=1 Tax=Azohydromonas aeria TaxID=2590212 RepID=UPI0012FA2626|nr:DUF354 domain-containing protein [Azohydromonas aeria]